MSLTTTKRGAVSAAVSRQVATNQEWHCAACHHLLPAAFQIDHKTPLWAGGADALSNLQALCANCHADKTQREAIERRVESNRNEKADAYDNREDVVLADGRFQCGACHKTRQQTTPHPVCWAIERRFETTLAAMADQQVTLALAKFAFHKGSS